MNHVALTGNTQVDKAVDTLTGGKIGGWLKAYENMVGLTEVREAQSKVIQVNITTPKARQQIIIKYPIRLILCH